MTATHTSLASLLDEQPNPVTHAMPAEAPTAPSKGAPEAEGEGREGEADEGSGDGEGGAQASAEGLEPTALAGSPANGVVETIIDESTGSPVTVERVGAAEAVDPEARKGVDRRREKLIAQLGDKLTPEDIERVLAIRASNAKGQRKLEMGADPLSPIMREFFAGRDDDAIEEDMAKAIRRDGGKHGALGVITNALAEAGVPAGVIGAAARSIHALWGKRTLAIRQVVIATVNELRVRRAEAAKRDARGEAYLKARE